MLKWKGVYSEETIIFVIVMGVSIQSHTAFRKFFLEFFPSVYALMLKYTGDKEIARDLTQEAFVRVYESREEFERIDNAKAFLYTVARRLYFNYYKHEKIRKNLFGMEIKEEEEEDFLQAVTLNETIRILYAAINKLAPQTRKIILLNLQGKNNNEIAEELHISVNTVKSMKKSAYQVLRKYLNAEYLWLLPFLLDWPF